MFPKLFLYFTYHFFNIDKILITLKSDIEIKIYKYIEVIVTLCTCMCILEDLIFNLIQII